MSSFYNEKGEYIHRGGETVPKHLAPDSMRFLHRMHYKDVPALRNKGFLELKTEADTLGISMQELVSKYEKGELP